MFNFSVQAFFYSVYAFLFDFWFFFVLLVHACEVNCCLQMFKGLHVTSLWIKEVRNFPTYTGCICMACDRYNYLLHIAWRCQTYSLTLNTIIALLCLQTCLSRWYGCHSWIIHYVLLPQGRTKTHSSAQYVCFSNAVPDFGFLDRHIPDF